MKRSFLLLSVTLLGILVTAIFSCEEDPKETCQQDEICEAKSVTACCTDDICVYKYNGKEYTEDEVGQLAIDLGCGSASMVKKSAGRGDDLSDVIVQLKVLMKRVQEQIRSNN